MKIKYKNWNIRRIAVGDVEPVLSFIIPMLQELYPNIPNVTVRWDLASLEKAYIEDHKTAMFVAFDQAGKVVGTIAIRPYDDRLDRVKGCYDVTRTAELSRCYIDSSLRRQGIAGKLLSVVEDYCRSVGYNDICLHTHRFLSGGYPFWQSREFVVQVFDNDRDETIYMDKSLVINQQMLRYSG